MSTIGLREHRHHPPAAEGCRAHEAPGEQAQEQSSVQDAPPAIFSAKQSCIAQLSTGARTLIEICQSNERRFLELGSDLQAIHQDAMKLTRQISLLLQDQEEWTIQTAVQTIRGYACGAMEELQGSHESLNGDLSRITTVMGDLNELEGRGGDFKQIAKTLKMVGLNITIESVHADTAREMFHGLAEEIKALSSTVSEVAEQIREDTDQAGKTLRAAHIQMQAGVHQLEGLLAKTGQSVENALDHVASYTASMVDLISMTGVSAKSIADYVGQVVMGIQIHDNVTQRAQHIQQSLLDTIQELSAVDSNTHPGLTASHAVLQLQISQLETILSDIEEAHRAAQNAFKRLHALISELARQSAAVFDTENVDTACIRDESKQNSVRLRQALESLLTLFTGSAESAAKLSAAKQQTARTIARMNQHIEKVRDVNFDIHLKALNAIVKSTRLGSQGKGIEVLVLEMKELADRSNVFIQEITQLLQKIIALNADEDHRSSDGRSGHQSQSSGDRLREGIQKFSAVCDSFKEGAGNALESSAALQKKILDAQGRLGFLSGMKAQLEQQLAMLTTVRGDLEPFAGEIDDDLLRHNRLLAMRYTMEKERDIHRRILEGSALEEKEDSSSAPVAQAETNHQQEEFGDNVELF